MSDVYLYLYIKADDKEGVQSIQNESLSIPIENIFADCTGRNEDENKRPMLDKLISTAKKSDLIYIKSLGSLGERYSDILDRWQRLTKESQADIAVLDEPGLDTRRGQGLMDGFVSDIVAETLEFAARHNKELARERQIKGYVSAKGKGVRFGRPPKPLPDNFHKICMEWKAGNITGTDAAKACDMPLSSFRYRAKKLGIVRRKEEAGSA